MDGAQVGVFEEADKVGLGRLLEGHDSRALEAEVSLEVLCDLTNKALEGQLANEKLGALLVPTDFSKSHSTRAVTVGLLDASGGGGRLAGRLGGELLARRLSTRALTSCLLCTGHYFLFVVERTQPNSTRGEQRLTRAGGWRDPPCTNGCAPLEVFALYCEN